MVQFDSVLFSVQLLLAVVFFLGGSLFVSCTGGVVDHVSSWCKVRSSVGMLFNTAGCDGCQSGVIYVSRRSVHQLCNGI